MITQSDTRGSKGIDKKFLLAAIAIEDEIQHQLDKTSSNMNEAVMKYATATGITDQDALVTALALILASFVVVLADTIADGSGIIAQYKVDEAIEQFIPLLRAAGAGDAADSFKRELGNYVQDTIKRFRYRTLGDKDFGFRIKTIHEGTEKTVRNIVANGVKEGKSAKQIATDLEQYINPLAGKPKVQPWEQYRKRFGRPKDFTPKDVNPGTLQYNALRIARTESAEVYRQATEDFYADKAWVKGFKWVLSNSHDHTDICDAYAAQAWPKNTKRPFAHPMCLCDWVAVPYTQDEITKMMKQGKL